MSIPSPSSEGLGWGWGPLRNDLGNQKHLLARHAASSSRPPRSKRQELIAILAMLRYLRDHSTTPPLAFTTLLLRSHCSANASFFRCASRNASAAELSHRPISSHFMRSTFLLIPHSLVLSSNNI